MNDEHDYKPEVRDCVDVWFVDLAGYETDASLGNEAAAEHFAATLRGDKAKTLAAEVADLKAQRDEDRSVWFDQLSHVREERDDLAEQVKRLAAELDHYAHLAALTGDGTK